MNSIEIRPGDTVEEISTGRVGKVNNTEGENPIANLVPGFTTTKWHVMFLDGNEPKSKVFTIESDLRLIKRAPA